MSNSFLRNIADAFEAYRNEEDVDAIVDMIISKIIAVSYKQSIKVYDPKVQYGEAPRSMYDTVMDKKLSIKIMSLYPPRPAFNKRGIDGVLSQLYKRNDFKPMVPVIISKVQQAFPEMKITVDPLETYILFDWS